MSSVPLSCVLQERQRETELADFMASPAKRFHADIYRQKDTGGCLLARDWPIHQDLSISRNPWHHVWRSWNWSLCCKWRADWSARTTQPDIWAVRWHFCRGNRWRRAGTGRIFLSTVCREQWRGSRQSVSSCAHRGMWQSPRWAPDGEWVCHVGMPATDHPAGAG